MNYYLNRKIANITTLISFASVFYVDAYLFSQGYYKNRVEFEAYAIIHAAIVLFVMAAVHSFLLYRWRRYSNK